MRKLLALLVLMPSVVHASGIYNPGSTGGGGGGGSGTVNPGSPFQAAVYANAAGTTTVNGSSQVTINTSSVTIPNLFVTTVTVQSVNNTFVGMGRNRIINGDMQLSQRNSTKAVNIITTGHNYVLDRWFGTAEPSKGIFSMKQSTYTVNLASPVNGPPGFLYMLALAVPNTWGTPSTGYYFGQAIEANNMRDFNFGTVNASTVTLSFWFYNNQTSNTQYGGSLQNSAQNRSYPFSFSGQSLTWNYITITMPGDTAGTWTTGNTAGLYVIFDLGSVGGSLTSSGTWVTGNYQGTTGDALFINQTNPDSYLTGIQLEIGTKATSFEFLPASFELLLCQRYYEKTYDVATTTGTATELGAIYKTLPGATSAIVQYGTSEYKVSKVQAPSITAWDINGVVNDWLVRDTGGSINADGSFEASMVNTNGFRFRVTGITGSPLTSSSSSNFYTAYGQLAIDAEF